MIRILFVLGMLLCRSAVYGQANVYCSLVQQKADTLFFDVYIQAANQTPIYLAFYDLVWKFPAGALKTGPKAFGLVKGSGQLVNFAGDQVTYEAGTQTRLAKRDDYVYCIVEVMPNYFEAMDEFLENCVFIGNEAFRHRLGRFYLVGLQDTPRDIAVHIAEKGPRTLFMQFEPKPNFKAIDLALHKQYTAACLKGLQSFEAFARHDSLFIDYDVATDKLTKWQISLSEDGKVWQAYEGKHSQHNSLVIAKANWRYVRLHANVGSKRCEGPVRKL
jgi:hypothetical protein